MRITTHCLLPVKSRSGFLTYREFRNIWRAKRAHLVVSVRDIFCIYYFCVTGTAWALHIQ